MDEYKTSIIIIGTSTSVCTCTTGVPMGGAPYKYAKEWGWVLFQLCHICPPCV